MNRIPGLKETWSCMLAQWRLTVVRALRNAWPGWSQPCGSGSVATDKHSQRSRLFDWRCCAYKNNFSCARGISWFLWSYFRVCLGKAPEKSSVWLWTVTNTHSQGLRAWGVCHGQGAEGMVELGALSPSYWRAWSQGWKPCFPMDQELPALRAKDSEWGGIAGFIPLPCCQLYLGSSLCPLLL